MLTPSVEVCTHGERMGKVGTAKEAECETFVCVSNSTGLSVSLCLGLSLLPKSLSLFP